MDDKLRKTSFFWFQLSNFVLILVHRYHLEFQDGLKMKKLIEKMVDMKSSDNDQFKLQEQKEEEEKEEEERERKEINDNRFHKTISRFSIIDCF